jgi:hypothetical protein
LVPGPERNGQIASVHPDSRKKTAFTAIRISPPDYAIALVEGLSPAQLMVVVARSASK